MRGLDSLATVRTPGAGGNFTTVSRADLPCRLAEVDAGGASGGTERAELLSTRLFLWADSTYTIPRNARITLDDGTLWTPRPGTQTKVYRGRGARRAYHHSRVDVTQVQS